MMLRNALSVLLLLSVPGVGATQEVATGEGPALYTYGSRYFDSSLVQKWVVVNDPALPVRIDPAMFRGVAIRYDEGYLADVLVPIEVSEPIAAVQVQLAHINVWNEVGSGLVLTEIMDIAPGPDTLTERWRLQGDANHADILTLVMFVRQVRLVDGTVMSANLDPVVAEIRKLVGPGADIALDDGEGSHSWIESRS